jgi:hypothetical protein
MFLFRGSRRSTRHAPDGANAGASSSPKPHVEEDHHHEWATSLTSILESFESSETPTYHETTTLFIRSRSCYSRGLHRSGYFCVDRFGYQLHDARHTSDMIDARSVAFLPTAALRPTVAM